MMSISTSSRSKGCRSIVLTRTCHTGIGLALFASAPGLACEGLPIPTLRGCRMLLVSCQWRCELMLLLLPASPSPRRHGDGAARYRSRERPRGSGWKAEAGSARTLAHHRPGKCRARQARQCQERGESGAAVHRGDLGRVRHCQRPALPVAAGHWQLALGWVGAGPSPAAPSDRPGHWQGRRLG
jgi:hypothetical protein